MEDIIASIQETFEQSAINDLRKYIAENDGVKKVMIFSDYCIGDKNKPNDVFSFTIMPYDDLFDNLTKEICSLTKKDIKKKQCIEPEFITYLKNRRLFHINFIINERKGITRLKDLDDEQVVSAMLDNTDLMLDKWIINTPSNADYFCEIKKKMSAVKNEMQKKAPNYKIFRDTILLSLLAGYICYLLVKEAKPEIVSWFSDRDKMVDVYGRVAYENFGMNYHGLCEQNGIPSEISKICVGIPTTNDAGGLWYDEMIRIPDHFAGTLADWDIDNNLNSKDKFITMIEGVIADNNFCVIIESSFEVNCYSSKRIVTESKPKPFN